MFKYSYSGFNLKMNLEANYLCLECGQIFENRVQAVIHHMEEKHQNFQIIGTDFKMLVKS